MRLSDILSNGTGDGFGDWDKIEAAGDFSPLPPGEYTAHIVESKLEKVGKNETPSYTLSFKIVEGDYAGRKFWHNVWLTPQSKPQAKRDLLKLGFTSFEQCDLPIPRFIRCKCSLALRRDDDGNDRNRLKSFEVLGIDKPEQDTFAPAVAAAPQEPVPNSSEPPAVIPIAEPKPNGGGNVPF